MFLSFKISQKNIEIHYMATGSLKRYIQFESQIKMIGCCCCVAVQCYLSLASRKALANGLYLIFRAVICTENTETSTSCYVILHSRINRAPQL